MPAPIISVKGLSKQYILGAMAGHDTLRDQIAHGTRALLSAFRHGGGKPQANGTEANGFWALKDVSFDLAEGQVLGIVGRNGAGKSTLLKILSQITEPSEGEIRVRGRVASLLEVGTGFHPELTGRENVYLNGAILGMTRREIRAKFNEIVAFAGVDKFLDTPVKRYSSGMYVRLAFAVAAHLDPEILLVDEVLAVGDASFQKKCLGKMEEVARTGGRTVLFVSHNMHAVEQLCSSAILLENGRLKDSGTDVRRIITDYMFGQETIEGSEWRNPGGQFANPWFFPLRIFIGDAEGNPLRMPVRNDDDFYFHAEGEVERLDDALHVGCAVYGEDGSLLFLSYHTDVDESQWKRFGKGRSRISTRLPRQLLNEGLYKIEFVAGLHTIQWISEPAANAPAIYLRIQGGLSTSPYWLWRRRGVLAPVLEWDITPVS